MSVRASGLYLKIFRDHRSGVLQEAVNEWLAENPTISIQTVLQSQSPRGSLDDIVMSIFYRNVKEVDGGPSSEPTDGL